MAKRKTNAKKRAYKKTSITIKSGTKAYHKEYYEKYMKRR